MLSAVYISNVSEEVGPSDIEHLVHRSQQLSAERDHWLPDSRREKFHSVS